MEIFVFIIIVLVIIFALGSLDYNSPVENWSDEKLNRMRGKLHSALGAYAQANFNNEYKKTSEKLSQVEAEIEKRKQKRIKELGEKQFDPNNPHEIAELSMLFAEKAHQLTVRVMNENSCTEQRANEIISQKIESLTRDFISKGFNEEDAGEKAIQQLLGIQC